MIQTKASAILNDSTLPGTTVKEALEAASSAGLAPADRAKLDGIEAGATQNSTDSALRDRASHTGTQAASTISDFAAAARAATATQLVAGSNVAITPVGDTLVLSATGGGGGLDPADRAKLDGIEAGATANSADSYLLNRANHTGTQAISTVTGLDTALAAKLTSTDPVIASGTVQEDVFAITDAAGAVISPTNGSIQTWALGANRTPTAGTWLSGQGILLMVAAGATFTITWTSLPVTWLTSNGNPPALKTTGYTAIVLWKVGTTIYGK